jgi:ankyrin repeat protein
MVIQLIPLRGPLDWALAHRQYIVARWLLGNGADVHHISARGWTPAFSLFGEESYHQNSCEEFLELLLGASFDNFNAQDGAGWTIMHRAAAWGNADHVKSLLARGATLDARMSNLGWTPIFCAVQFNNLSTFSEIVQNQPGFLAATDARGWTLLHVAVNASRLEMIQLLIELGADPHALSFPTASYIPEGMRNLSLTPGDIANIRGSTVLAAYLGALAASGHEVHTVANEKGDTLDLFWPSNS